MKFNKVSRLKLTPSLCRHFHGLQMRHKIGLDCYVLLKPSLFGPPFLHLLWLWRWSSSYNDNKFKLATKNWKKETKQKHTMHCNLPGYQTNKQKICIKMSGLGSYIKLTQQSIKYINQNKSYNRRKNNENDMNL